MAKGKPKNKKVENPRQKEGERLLGTAILTYGGVFSIILLIIAAWSTLKKTSPLEALSSLTAGCYQSTQEPGRANPDSPWSTPDSPSTIPGADGSAPNDRAHDSQIDQLRDIKIEQIRLQEGQNRLQDEQNDQSNKMETRGFIAFIVLLIWPLLLAIISIVLTRRHIVQLDKRLQQVEKEPRQIPEVSGQLLSNEVGAASGIPVLSKRLSQTRAEMTEYHHALSKEVRQLQDERKFIKKQIDELLKALEALHLQASVKGAQNTTDTASPQRTSDVWPNTDQDNRTDEQSWNSLGEPSRADPGSQGHSAWDGDRDGVLNDSLHSAQPPLRPDPHSQLLELTGGLPWRGWEIQRAQNTLTDWEVQGIKNAAGGWTPVTTTNPPAFAVGRQGRWWLIPNESKLIAFQDCVPQGEQAPPTATIKEITTYPELRSSPDFRFFELYRQGSFTF